MQWTVHVRRSIYESAWVSLELVDVERGRPDRVDPLAGIPRLIDEGAIVSGPSLIALLYVLTTRESPGHAPRRD